MKHTITLIPGDGIGPEVSSAVKEIIAAADVSVNWEEIPNRKEFESTGRDFIKAGVMPSLLKNRVALKGPLETAVAGGAPSLNVALRQALELYANVRPVKNLEGVQARFKDVDVVLIRENTEDLYAGLEHTVVPGVVESLKIITEKASTRIAKFAFEYARANGRKKIHAIHKANIMKLSDG
ncbi:MAG TPA: isocitrate/isopropylmalate family dehydrogenase, partial [Candidatus Acidoferrum sp.]|nr:isocitrate/isopropylmalate family dehydrogenase [Candidatus Acidoferrum sp.]